MSAPRSLLPPPWCSGPAPLRDPPPLCPQMAPDRTWGHPAVEASWLGAGGAGRPGRGLLQDAPPLESPLARMPPARPVGVQAGLRGRAGGLWGSDAPLSLEIGLCANMRSLPWHVQADPDTFFPRCYSLCSESEKQEFLGKWVAGGGDHLASGRLWGPPPPRGCRKGGGWATAAGPGGWWGLRAEGPVPSRGPGAQLHVKG